jgi:hypothetical protein
MKLNRRSVTRATRALAVTSIVALGVAAPAAADQPDRRTETFVVENVPVIACANGQSAMASFTLTRTVTTFFDQDGNPLREVRHARVVGTIASEDGSRSAPYGGRIHRVFDFTTGLVTVTGRSLFAELPGRDPATAGRYVYDPETDTFVVERGRTPTESEREICAYLYPAG